MNKVITVGIAGLGRSGWGIHANWLKDCPEKYRVVAVADKISERRQDAVALFGCKTYADYREMLVEDQFDLFVNATPSKFHVDAAIAALKNNCNVLNEKPSAKTVADFDRITTVARQTGKIFYPFQNARFYPFFQKMREIIDSGILGDIVFIRSNWSGYARRWDWQTLQSEWGGNLLNTGPHPVDQAIVLFGEEYPEVSCKMYANHPSGGDAENFCTLMLTGQEKPTIEIVLNSFQVYPQGEMYNISGTFGGLTGGPKELKWKYFNPAEAPPPELWRSWSKNRKYCIEQLPWKEDCWKYDEKDDNANGFYHKAKALYNDLYEVLTNHAEQEIKLEQVRRQIYVIEQAHKQNKL